MYTWIIYDISDNRNRRWIAKLCRQSGLLRVQKSVFLGKVSKPKLADLISGIEVFVDETDRLFVVPMNESEYNNMLLIGQPFDTKRVSRGYKTMFF